MPETPKKRILFVDDELFFLDSVRRILKNQRDIWQINYLERGIDALQEVARIDYDVIVTDITMPGMDGFQLLAELRKSDRTRDVPVIVLTGNSENDLKRRALELDATDLLTKPVHPEDLIARLRSALRTKEYQDQIKTYSRSLEVMVEERTRQLIHADRLATLGTLSAALAHEVNNPLQFIVSNADLLKASIDQLSASMPFFEELVARADKWNARADAILHGVDRIAELVKRLKAYGRKNSDKEHAPYDISDALQDALALLRYRIVGSLSVSVTVPPKVIVVGDRQALGQVFVNLIGNAMDALHGKGTIEVVAERRSGGVDISVKDNGPGIPGDCIDQIFDPFFTTKRDQDGTGLGLFIVRDILAAQSGTIVCRSTPGEGTVFVVTLPIAKSGTESK